MPPAQPQHPCLTAVSYRCISGECVRVRLLPQAVLYRDRVNLVLVPARAPVLPPPPHGGDVGA